MKMNHRNMLLPAGLLLSSVSQLVSHFTQLPDFVAGSLTGIGIGLMLLAFIRPVHISEGK